MFNLTQNGPNAIFILTEDNDMEGVTRKYKHTYIHVCMKVKTNDGDCAKMC